MPTDAYILAAVVLSGILTWSMRALPFAVLAKIRSNPLVGYLSREMPLGVMVILVVYLLQDIPWAGGMALIPFVLAIAVTVALQLWRHSAFLSIFAGTGTHVILLAVLG